MARCTLSTDSQGQMTLGALIAAGIIITATLGTTYVYQRLADTMRRVELTNLAVGIESSFVQALNDKANFPDVGANSPNEALRNGTATSLPLIMPFGTITVPVNISTGAAGASGFLDTDFNRCAAYSKTCVAKFDIRLLKTSPAVGLYAYQFGYQIELNPELSNMVPLGSLKVFTNTIDPGNYRATDSRTKCDPVNGLFALGFNRDTGESFCAKKPTPETTTCPTGYLPKGIKYISGGDSNTPGTLQLLCSGSPIREFSCPPNYSISEIHADLIDPDLPESSAQSPGKCIFHTEKKTNLIGGNYPPDPTSPYRKKVEGTFCPPFYESSSLHCDLVPDSTRNSSMAWGMGRCGSTATRDCGRTFRTRKYLVTAEWETWDTNGRLGPEPDHFDWYTTCSDHQNSHTCNGVPDSPATCSSCSSGTCHNTTSSWDSGIEYAYDIRDITPTAEAIKTPSGRRFKCTFSDTSPPCTAPATDYSGNFYGKKSPKWYGGVVVGGGDCNYDPSQNTEQDDGAEVIEAKLGH